jgi:hypothetical protein
MAELFEVPVVTDDGAKDLPYANIEAISHVDVETDAAGEASLGMRMCLNNGL